MKGLLYDKMNDILYRIAYAKYNDNYSSADYSYEIRMLEHMLAPLITLAKELNMELSVIKGSYCGCSVCAEDYDDMETKLKYL